MKHIFLVYKPNIPLPTNQRNTTVSLETNHPQSIEQLNILSILSSKYPIAHNSFILCKHFREREPPGCDMAPGAALALGTFWTGKLWR